MTRPPMSFGLHPLYAWRDQAAGRGALDHARNRKPPVIETVMVDRVLPTALGGSAAWHHQGGLPARRPWEPVVLSPEAAGPAYGGRRDGCNMLCVNPVPPSQ